MANPSLQIGNSNWAIKEDNLLGYSTAGTRFVPQPITMTRASAGTRVNSSGLVETVELLGSELVDDGSFPLPNTEWSLTGGAEVTALGGRIYSSSGGVSSLDQGIGMVVGKNYKITLDVIATNGTKLSNPSGTNIYDTSTVGSKVFYITAAYSTLYFKRYSGITDVTINNVSVKESTKNNLARVDYDGTASSLLVEPERTNVIPYSEEISQYNQSSSTASDNETISPDGTNNASKISKDGGNANDRVTTIITISNSTDYSLSAFIKNDDVANGGVSTIGARITGGTVFRQGYEWNGSTLSVTNSSQSGTRTNVLLEDYGNGWWKVGFSFTSDGTEARLEFDIDRVNGTDTTAIFLWGAQLEAGSYGTSYIPNFGTALGVTRVKDQYSKTGISNLINSTEGVLFLETAALADDGTNRYISISSSITPSDDYIYFRFMSTSNRVLCRTRVGGSTISTIEKTITDTTDYNKYAIKWKSGDYAFWINGVEVGTDTNSTIFGADVLNQIRFDFPVGSGTFPSKVKQLQVFTTALTDTQLAALTS